VPDRTCVAALVFMARTSTPWSLLPAKELGCGSATTCWRRLDEGPRAGVFEQLQAVLLDELGAAGRIANRGCGFCCRVRRCWSDGRVPWSGGK
jgi:transposase